MSVLQALLLGALQGATEFLPVSSSGHLVLVPWLLSWPSPDLTFDAIVHWGTALALVVYFWRDWASLVVAVLRSLGATLQRLRAAPAPQRFLAEADASDSETVAEPDRGGTDIRVAWCIVLGTVPAALIGYFLEDFVGEMFARPLAPATFLLVTAALLGVSERLGRRERDLSTLTWTGALFIGLSQALAILPGISRSGATIAAGLALGLRRTSSARFSFLLATPITLGAGLLKLVKLSQAGDLAAQAPVLVAGLLVAGIVGFGCIHLLMRHVHHRRLYPFAVYCAVVGITSLIVLLLRGG